MCKWLLKAFKHLQKFCAGFARVSGFSVSKWQHTGLNREHVFNDRKQDFQGFCTVFWVLSVLIWQPKKLEQSLGYCTTILVRTLENKISHHKGP